MYYSFTIHISGKRNTLAPLYPKLVATWLLNML